MWGVRGKSTPRPRFKNRTWGTLRVNSDCEREKLLLIRATRRNLAKTSCPVMGDVLKHYKHGAGTGGQKCERPGRNSLPGSQAFRFYCAELALLAEGDDAEGTATVVVVAGSEKELIGIAVGASHATLAELNGPDIVDLDGLPVGVAEGPEESAGLGIKGVDLPARNVIRDQNRIALGPKSGCASATPQGECKGPL